MSLSRFSTLLLNSPYFASNICTPAYKALMFAVNWMFNFENYADQSLDRRQKLIGMRLGTSFFIYEMNGSNILLHMHTLIYGFTSHAKMIGIWPGMLLLYLHIGGFNVCYRGPIVASLWYSSRGPSTTYLGIRTSCVLQERTCGIMERSG